MTPTGTPHPVRVDGYTRFCLTAIALLLTVVIVGLWATGPAPSAGRALGEDNPQTERGILPNAGAQRQVIIEAIQTTNRKLDEIANLLTSGKVQVMVVEAKPPKEPGNVEKPPAK